MSDGLTQEVAGIVKAWKPRHYRFTERQMEDLKGVLQRGIAPGGAPHDRRIQKGGVKVENYNTSSLLVTKKTDGTEESTVVRFIKDFAGVSELSVVLKEIESYEKSIGTGVIVLMGEKDPETEEKLKSYIDNSEKPFSVIEK